MKNSNTPYSSFRLTIKAVTWSRDSHGLYDYESRNITKKLLSTTSSCYLSRAGTEINQISCEAQVPRYQVDPSDLSDPVDPSTLLCHIDTDNSNFSISGCSDSLWLVARTMKTRHGPGFIMQEGQILKLGRVCFKVSMIRTSLEGQDSDRTQDSEDFDIEIPNEREPGMCRICLSNESEANNPLISPCKCSGSMKFIHLMCLRQWLNSRKVSRTTDNCISFTWKSIDCEICKSNIPFSLDRIGKESELLRIEKPKSPFLVLEGVGNDKNSNKGVYIVAVTGNQGISLGRGHDADVRISDISVSRTHAIIRFVEDCFVVEDKNSKFGTLVSAQEKVKISANHNVVVQIGRSVISFSNKPHAKDSDPMDIN